MPPKKQGVPKAAPAKKGRSRSKGYEVSKPAKPKVPKRKPNTA